MDKNVVAAIQIMLASDDATLDHLRPHALLALGKFSLVNEHAAKSHTSVFAQELNSPNPRVRNNALMVLSDLCKRFTRLVDPYIPIMVQSLSEQMETMRMQAYLVLSKLLQEDYVKFKGALFYTFASGVVDSSLMISNLGKLGVDVTHDSP
jgi:condensin-2 complex subunit D3